MIPPERKTRGPAGPISRPRRTPRPDTLGRASPGSVAFSSLPWLLVLALALLAGGWAVGAETFPGRTWPTRTPAEAHLDPARLAEFSGFTGGRGVVVRDGHLVYAWGDPAQRGDVASAVKPLFTHFLFRAIREKRIASIDEPLTRWEPRLATLNPDLDAKDRFITWRHSATQTSGYGLREAPGTAFAYNDWQMALFIDLLFNRAYAFPWPEVDRQLLLPFLRDTLGCEDSPSFVAHAGGRQPGRLAISPRDFARFGLLYLRHGRWENHQVVPREDVDVILHSPLPNSLPRAGTNAAALLPGQRTLGSQRIPDNQTEHFGSYSFLWWVNGLQADGRRHWPNAPTNTFAALGHGGIRGLAVFPDPDLDLVVSWNDTSINSPVRENEMFRRLLAAVQSPTQPPPPTAPAAAAPPDSSPPRASRLRLIIETDAGGDPDDEQSLVRFLLYANEWDLEAIIANRPQARDGENRNPERTGVGIVRRLVHAYGQGWTNLVRHDPRYPTPDHLLERVVDGANSSSAAVHRLIAAVDAPDPRPLWYSDWGTDHGAATNNLRRALDQVLRDRGPAGYARFKSRLRLVSADAFGPHTAELDPPFPLWVDTWRPELDGRRWYHRFSALTATAGGFDLTRDVLTGHGPLGALYPTNTTHPQKEGDTLSFLYLVPNGLNVPEEPGWGGWGGRLGPNPRYPGKPYFWANQRDAWNGSTHRDHTLARWAGDLQNDFRVRLAWLVSPPATAPALVNHPPVVRLSPLPPEVLVAGQSLELSAAESSDPEAGPLDITWIFYPEAGTWTGPVDFVAEGPRLRLTAPPVTRPETLHFIARVADRGTPPLARYARAVLTVVPGPAPTASPLPANLAPWSQPPTAGLISLPTLSTNLPPRRPVLRFDDGRPVRLPADWPARREEIRRAWTDALGPWPPLVAEPRLETLREEHRETFRQARVRLPIAPDQTGEGWLLVPDGPGPFPAVLVVYYEPETSVGLNPKQARRDFALELTRRGFVTLSIGTPGGNAWKPELGDARCQPLSFHAYVAANAGNALARLPFVDPLRIGVTGHSYGGKWALFAAALWDRFAAVAVSDPGIAFDETRPNVNYWEPWYLGLDPDVTRAPGLPDATRPRTGAYRRLVEAGHDLHEIHALVAPRPFLISGGAEDPWSRRPILEPALAVSRALGRPEAICFTTRPTHDPTAESNAQLYEFFTHHLTARRP